MRDWDNREKSYGNWFNFGAMFTSKSRKLRLFGNFLMFSGIFTLGMLGWTATMFLIDLFPSPIPSGFP